MPRIDTGGDRHPPPSPIPEEMSDNDSRRQKHSRIEARSQFGMTVQHTEVALSYEELEALCSERNTLVHTLRQQIRDLETQRQQAIQGIELLTDALRRRGCCDHESTDGSL